MSNKQYDELRERLAENAHGAWSRWMTHIFSLSRETESGEVVIPIESVQRWRRQIATDYEDLPESEKQSDRNEADKIIKLLS